VKILFVSTHNPNFINTSVYREKAVEGLGHELEFFGDRSFIIPGRIRQRFAFLQEWDLKRLNNKLSRLAANKKFDLCMVVGGYRVLPETLAEMKKRGLPLILWTTDAPINFGNIIKTAPIYDYVFCAGTEAVEILKNNGISKLSWLPFACDPEYHRPIELSGAEKRKYGKDIVFVGSFYPNRARVLESITDLDISVLGPNWNKLDKDSPLRKKTASTKVNYDEWVRIYNASKIVMSIHFDDGKTPCNQASPRLYEALACGSFVMADEQKDAKALFEDGEHLVFFKNEKDLRDKIIYYLDHPEERQRIALKGREEVIKKHTYTHRIKEMLDTIKTRGVDRNVSGKQ
jgi:spore maturation protein CgeB